MVRLRTPLLSLEARGRLGPLAFTRRRAVNIVEKRPDIPDAGTRAQTAQRAWWLEAIAAWWALTDAERAVFRTNARKYRLSGYQYFIHLYVTPAPPPPPWNGQVAASLDDCSRMVSGGGYWSTLTWSLYIGDYSITAYDYISGVRFRNVTAPIGSTVAIATVELYAYQRYPALPTLWIKGEAHDNPPQFSSAANFDARVKGAQVGTWPLPAFVVNTWYESPNIKEVILEIIDRPGWAPGQAMVLFLSDNTVGWGGVRSKIEARTWDFTGNTYGAKLHLTFE